LEGFKVAVNETDAGMGLISRPAAGLLAGGAAAVASAAHVGIYGIEKSADNAMEVYENTRKGAQEFSELIANNAKGLAEKGMDLTEKGMEVGGHMFERCLVEGNDAYKVTLKSGTELAIQTGSGAMSIVKKGMESGDDMRKELKEFSENMAKLGLEGFGDVMHTTADTIEN